MEINSHPGIGYLQAYEWFYTDLELKEYFHSKIRAIDSLSPEQKQLRNMIRS